MAFSFGVSLNEWDEMLPFEMDLYTVMLNAKQKEKNRT